MVDLAFAALPLPGATPSFTLPTTTLEQTAATPGDDRDLLLLQPRLLANDQHGDTPQDADPARREESDRAEDDPHPPASVGLLWERR